MDDIIYNILCLKTGLIVLFLVLQELHLVILRFLRSLGLGDPGSLTDHALLLLLGSGRLACPGSAAARYAIEIGGGRCIIIYIKRKI